MRHATNEYLAKLRSYLPGLAADYGVRSLGLFGSRVKGMEQFGSDLDILVTFDEVPSLLELIRLEQHLSDALGVKVDLVLRNALKPSIRRQVLRELVPI